MTKRTYQIEGMNCPNCAAKIEKVLKNTKGVFEPEILYNSGRVRLNFDEDLVSSEIIVTTIEKMGFKVISEK